MAKKALLTVDATCRTVKKGLITVDETYRKIKRALISVGGVYRPCWFGGELAYYGAVTALSSARTFLAAGTVGEHALFAGGALAAGNQRTVDTYNTSLVRSSAAQLTVANGQFGGVNIGEKVLFFGGNREATNRTVDIYSADLTKTASATAQRGRNAAYPTRNDHYALFCGGYGAVNRDYCNGEADAYDADLTHVNAPALAAAVYEGRGTHAGEYALFGGGENVSDNGVYTHTATVNAYDGSLTRTTVAPLSAACANIAAERVGHYSIFVCNSVANAYDTDLTQTAIAALSTPKRMMASVHFHHAAMFIGGWAVDQTSGVSTVDVYDETLTRTNAAAITAGRGGLAAAALGSFAICAGGISGDTYYNAAEAFTVV